MSERKTEREKKRRMKILKRNVRKFRNKNKEDIIEKINISEGRNLKKNVV